MKSLGIETELRNVGKQNIEGQILDLPPVILGKLLSGTDKRTVLVYGHYDVQPAMLEDGWQSDPFTLQERNGKLYGRGSSDDKGPVLAWLLAIETFQKSNISIPVNIVFCFEGMEESGSEGLDKLIKQEAKNYFKDVDCVCISDNCIALLIIRLARY